MDVFPGLESPDSLSIPDSMDCFSGLHRLTVLESLNDILDDLDDLAITPSFVTLKI